MLKFSVYKVLLIVFLIFHLPLIGNAKTDLEEAMKYYPINTGDIRKYITVWDSNIANFSTFIVGNDTLMDNGKTYNEVDYSLFERVDSTTANVYRYDNANGGVESEILLDSLLCNISDTYCSRRHEWYYDNPEQRAQYVDIYENNLYYPITQTKEISRYLQYTDGKNIQHSLARNIGLTFFRVFDLFNPYPITESQQILVYAKIDSIEYNTIDLEDYHMLQVGNYWQFTITNENNDYLGLRNVEVLKDTLIYGKDYKILKFIEKDQNDSIVNNWTEDWRYDLEYNVIGNDYPRGDIEESTYFDVNTLKRTVHNHNPGGYYFKYYHKELGLTYFCDNANDIYHNLIYAVIDGVEYGESGISDNNTIYDYKLMQNYPNPFNPETTISYSLMNNTQVSLKVFDIAGREVCSLVDNKQNKGSYEVKFDGSMLTSGIYFYSLSVDGKAVSNKKMMLLK